MPALMTHHLFGEESIELLPPAIIQSEDDRLAFLLANQGPDPFFFHVRTPAVKTCVKLAQVMHRSRMTRQFESLRAGVTRLQRADAGTGRAFVLGLLSHYVLDRNAHPFVYAQQWGIMEQDSALEGAGGKVHAVIESDLDLLMLQRKRGGATVRDYPPVDELVTTHRIDMIAGALVASTARAVYDLPVGGEEYGGAVADMQLVYRLIEPQGSPRSRLLAGIEGLLGGYSQLDALAHRVTTEPPSACGNMSGLPWENPFTHEVSHETFPQVFDRALADYRQAAAGFIAGGDLSAVTRHINYSGRPLAPDEEFDREE